MHCREGNAIKLSRRKFLHLAAGAGALPAPPRTSLGANLSVAAGRIIVGFAAGGEIDMIARLIGQSLSERLGQPFVIENRPGAGTNIGTEAVVRATPDGYTLLLIYARRTLQSILPCMRSLISISFATLGRLEADRRAPRCVGHPSFAAKTVPEFIDYAKANPGKINHGLGRRGRADHMAGELFKMMAGVNMVHVPYRGGAPA